jgi:hypothetical protein
MAALWVRTNPDISQMGDISKGAAITHSRQSIEKYKKTGPGVA